jgi:hypothetical protein
MTLATAALLALGMTASAQYRPRDESSYSDRDHQNQMLDRMRSNLLTAQATATPLTGDRMRIDNALEEVSTLQYNLDRGNYDGRQFDRTVQAVQQVLRRNALSDRSWDALTDDSSLLRNMEARSADWR